MADGSRCYAVARWGTGLPGARPSDRERAEVNGRTFVIRVNDFPAEPLYTVLCGGEEVEDLEDWPPALAAPAP